MAPSEAKKMAENYLKAQAKIIERYGDAPKLFGDKYKRVVSATQKTFANLRSASDKLK